MKQPHMHWERSIWIPCTGCLQFPPSQLSSMCPTFGIACSATVPVKGSYLSVWWSWPCHTPSDTILFAASIASLRSRPMHLGRSWKSRWRNDYDFMRMAWHPPRTPLLCKLLLQVFGWASQTVLNMPDQVLVGKGLLQLCWLDFEGFPFFAAGSRLS